MNAVAQTKYAGAIWYQRANGRGTYTAHLWVSGPLAICGTRLPYMVTQAHDLATHCGRCQRIQGQVG